MTLLWTRNGEVINVQLLRHKDTHTHTSCWVSTASLLFSLAAISSLMSDLTTSCRAKKNYHFTSVSGFQHFLSPPRSALFIVSGHSPSPPGPSLSCYNPLHDNFHIVSSHLLTKGPALCFVFCTLSVTPVSESVLMSETTPT